MLITDPWFYATAIPAVLILGISKAGFGSSFGSLAVPLMALTISVPQATAILLPLLLVMDALGLATYWKQADWKLLKLLLPAGVVGIVLGWVFFRHIEPKHVGALVGCTAIGFVLLRTWQARNNANRLPYVAPRWFARLAAIGSGFTSFIAHAGGPPLSLYTLPLRMNPLTFVASMTVFFAVINVSKIVPYYTLGLLNWQNLATSAALVILAPIGNQMGLHIAKTINITLFYRIVNVALFASGSKLIWDAVK